MTFLNYFPPWWVALGIICLVGRTVFAIAITTPSLVQCLPDAPDRCAVLTTEVSSPSSSPESESQPNCHGNVFQNCTSNSSKSPSNWTWSFVRGLPEGTNISSALLADDDGIQNYYADLTVTAVLSSSSSECSLVVLDQDCASCSVCNVFNYTLSADCTNLENGRNVDCESFVDEVFYPLRLQNDTNNTISCSACDGPVNPNKTIPDGTTCTQWFAQSSTGPADSEDCLLSRVEGAAFCDCPLPYSGNASFCNPCSGYERSSVHDNADAIPPNAFHLSLPDDPGVTCGGLLQLPAVDGTPTCHLLYQKYAKYCRCLHPPNNNNNNNNNSTCTLCDSGADPTTDKPFPLSLPQNQKDLNFTCWGINEMLSVQTPTACPHLRNQIGTGGGVLDLQAYCGCHDNAAVSTKSSCGDFCVPGSSIPLDLMDFNTSSGYTCQQLQTLVHYPLDPTNDTCTSLQYYNQECCMGSSSSSNESSSFPTATPVPTSHRSPVSRQGITVWEVIANTTNSISTFRQGLESVNIDQLLLDPQLQFTVFAPLDEAMRNYPLIQLYRTNLTVWSGHITKVLEHHIVEGKVLTSAAALSSTPNLIETSLAGDNIVIGDGTVEGYTIVTPNLLADNGVVYEISGVLPTSWANQTIIDVLITFANSPSNSGTTSQTSPVNTNARAIIMNSTTSANNGATRRQLQTDGPFSALLNLLDTTGYASNPRLTGFSDNGVTLAAPQDAAFAETALDTAGMESTMSYHVIDSNVYLAELGTDSVVVVNSSHISGAQVLVTNDKTGTARYNDANIRNEVFASNGLIHELDKVLTPPGMVTQLGYLKNYTSTNVSTLQELFLASNWHTSNLSLSLATVHGTEKFTLFAPTDSFFDQSRSVVVDRLFRPEYARHLENLLQSLLVPTEYSLDEIIVSTDLQRGIQNMRTLSGFNQTISSLGGLSIGNAGSFLEPSLRGTDGFLHPVDGAGMPPSFAFDIHYQLSSDPDTRGFISNSETPSVLFDENTTLTCFVPVVRLRGKFISKDVFENHLVYGIFFTDQLQNMDGEVLTSVNGKLWQVKALNGSIALLADGGVNPVYLADKVDILANNGVIHQLDGVLYSSNESMSTSAPFGMESNETTSAPTRPRIYSNVTLAPSMTPFTTVVLALSSTNVTTTSISPTGAPSGMATNASTPVPTVETTNASTPVPTVETTTASPATSMPTAKKGEVLTLNTTFRIYNQKGLTAQDLTSFGVIFNRMFEDFVNNLVLRVKGGQARDRKLLRTISRMLTVNLQPNSPEVYAVNDVPCGNDPNIPKGSKCQDVYGKYNLQVANENASEVIKAFVSETDHALHEGKMQESLDRVAPDSPFTVINSDSSGQPAAVGDKGSVKTWPVVVLAVVGGLGLCCMVFAIIYYNIRMKPEEEELETSMKLLDEVHCQPGIRKQRPAPATVMPEDIDENGYTSDGEDSASKRESKFWEEQEELQQFIADDADRGHPMELAIAEEEESNEDEQADEQWEDEEPLAVDRDLQEHEVENQQSLRLDPEGITAAVGRLGDPEGIHEDPDAEKAEAEKQNLRKSHDENSEDDLD